MPAIETFEARSPVEYGAARALFEEYAEELGVDLCFQDFASELDHLAEMYAPPSGCFLLGRTDGAIVGCVGVRRVSADTCEMKRLYVRDAARGLGLGRRLALESIAAARALGYERMVLDTLQSLTRARELYRSIGFKETAPYYSNPLPDVRYLELDLRRARTPAA